MPRLASGPQAGAGDGCAPPAGAGGSQEPRVRAPPKVFRVKSMMSRPAEPRVQATSEGEASAAFTVAVQNVEYAALAARSSLAAAFTSAVEEAVASSAGIGITPEGTELMAGPGFVQILVKLPHGFSMGLVQSRLAACTSLGWTVASRVLLVDGIMEASSGPITAGHVGDAVPDALAEVQGTWERDAKLFHFTGGSLRFPSGGSAEVRVPKPGVFAITHASGTSFHARLAADGQELRWDNGSVWSRVAPRRAPDAVRRSLPESQLRTEQALDRACGAILDAVQQLEAEQESFRRQLREAKAMHSSLSRQIEVLRRQREEVNGMRKELEGSGDVEWLLTEIWFSLHRCSSVDMCAGRHSVIEMI